MVPPHQHAVSVATSAGCSGIPAGASLASDTLDTPYSPGPNPAAPVTLAPDTIAPSGGGQPHPNMQPWLGLLPCICSQGIYPSRP